MELGKLSPAPGAKTKSNRVGRGIGSGNGKTAGRGHKGQKARSGGSIRPGFEGGQMPLYRRIGKRGFKNFNKKVYTEITFAMLNMADESKEVTAESLKEQGIISKIEKDGIVILAKGELNKKLNVKAARFTASAKEKIEALGGKAEVI